MSVQWQLIDFWKDEKIYNKHWEISTTSTIRKTQNLKVWHALTLIRLAKVKLWEYQHWQTYREMETITHC